MPRASLPPNRNNQPLTENQVDRVFLLFRHLDKSVSVRHVPGQRTCFVVRQNPDGDEIGEVCFGADIQPGVAILDPNSTMSSLAAAAHEVTHYYRWIDGTELPRGPLDNIDEAITSLVAVLKFQDKLEWSEKAQLISDALIRLRLHLDGQQPDEVVLANVLPE